MTTPEDITTWPDRLESAIENTFINRVMVLNQTQSTQDAVARACIGLPNDHQATLIIASTQTMGRGQRANNWHDTPHQTLPCSIAIGPKLLNLNNPNLAARTGLAALNTIQHFAPDTTIKIKWPNDIVTAVGGNFVGKNLGWKNFGGKIAGILIEHTRDSIVLGIGINTLQTESDFHPSIQDTAISLAQLGCESTRIDLACKLIEQLNHWLTIAIEEEVITHWQKNDALTGTQAKLIHNNQPHTGTITNINPLDHIHLQTTTGNIQLPVEQTRLIL